MTHNVQDNRMTTQWYFVAPFMVAVKEACNELGMRKMIKPGIKRD